MIAANEFQAIHHQRSFIPSTEGLSFMLVLSRRENERIRLGESIVITVVRLSGDKVRLGIEAPPDVVVLREELEPFAPPGLVEAPATCNRGAR
jgi:carbon storage regulator